MSALVFGIVESTERGWTDPITLAALTAAALLQATLVLHEARAPQPIMPLRLFRHRERSGAYATRLLYMGAMIGFFYFTTQYLQDALGFTPLQAGLGFLPMTAVNFAVAMAIPRLTRRIPGPLLLLAGVITTLTGMLWLSRLDPAGAYLETVALPMLLIGAGQGLAFAPMTSAGISGLSSEDAGAGSGLINTAHQLGMALGLGVLVTISASTGIINSPADVADHVRTAITGSSALLGLALVVVLLVVVPVARIHAGPQERDGVDVEDYLNDN
ncbi:MFS transporter [Lentzea tibetensis]|uniref:MFS transporter n=1 Tax=Lentzea tibetensis TaxID=2591470 RepID=UPI00164701C4|nr:MFS transporter [Lentzea tibetensis]